MICNQYTQAPIKNFAFTAEACFQMHYLVLVIEQMHLLLLPSPCYC